MNPALIAAAFELAKYAGPRIGRWLGGAQGEQVARDTAESVVEVAQAITGEKAADSALEALRASPELQLEYLRAMADREVRIEQAYLIDMQSARQRDVALHQGGYGNLRADLLVFLVVASLMAIIWMLATMEVSQMVFSALNMALGALLKMLGDVFAFEFGSSRGSKEKDKWPTTPRN